MYRLLRLGVSLHEQGALVDGEVPAVLADWLMALDDVHRPGSK